MKRTGRTRARSRSLQAEGQRQPYFEDSALTDAPDTHGTQESTAGDGMSLEGTPPETQGGPEGLGEGSSAGSGERGEKKGVKVEETSRSDARRESEGESEEGSLSEESEDSQERTGEEKEQRTYWKEVEKKVEMGVNAALEKAHAARLALYEKQVGDLGVIVDPTSSEGEEEGDVAERRRARRAEREAEMGKRRAQKDSMYREYMESKRNIALDDRVVMDIRKTYEEQWEDEKTAERIGKILRANKRAADRREECRAQEEGRGDEQRKRRSGKDRAEVQKSRQGEQTPAGKRREGIQTRSTSRSSVETTEEEADVSIVLAAERGLPAEGEMFAHFTRLLGRTPTTGAEWDIEVTL
eukprot:5308859-Pleurochrysis_carterae.AAC.3